MSDALDPTRKDLLSSFLDQESAQTDAGHDHAADLIHTCFSAQLHYRNLEAVSRATQQAGAPVPNTDNFLSNLMGALDGLEQEDPSEDFEVLSAWYDGEWDFDTEPTSAIAETTRANLRTLGTAMSRLPVPAAPQGFAGRVMAAIAQTEQPAIETLSALYDEETHFAEVRCLQDAQLLPSAQTQLSNFATLSGALRRLPTPESASDFVSRVMAALPQPQQSFETLSAYYDLESNLELPESLFMLQDFTRLSAALQSLPTPEAPVGFAARVLQAVETSDLVTVSELHDGEVDQTDLNQAQEHRLRQLETLSAGFAALPQVTAPAGFVERVFQAIEADFVQLSAHHDGEAEHDVSEAQHEQLHVLTSLSAGFAALPEIQAPAGFVAKVMQAVDALPDFDTLSAAYDGEGESPFQVSYQQLQPLRDLSRALAALPQPQAPADFVAKVMLATEKASRPRLFALPTLFQTRVGQIAAGFAIFGILAAASYEAKQLIDGPSGQTTTAAVSIVQVENAPEDLLFSNPEPEEVLPSTPGSDDLLLGSPGADAVMDDTLKVDQTTEKDYNLIGG